MTMKELILLISTATDEEHLALREVLGVDENITESDALDLIDHRIADNEREAFTEADIEDIARRVVAESDEGN